MKLIARAALATLVSVAAPLMLNAQTQLHQWVNISTRPFSTNLWAGGGSRDSGYTEYVCRGRVGADVIPGRYNPTSGTNCFVGSDGVEVTLQNFEVLVNFSGVWEPASTTPGGFRSTPTGALVVATKSNGTSEYSCRAFYRGLIHVGRFSSTGAGCEIGLENISAVLPEFELLVNPWVGFPIPSAVNGLNVGSGRLACRAAVGGSIFPGEYLPSAIPAAQACIVTPAGGLPSQLVSVNFEVLTTAVTGTWVRTTRVIPGAFRAGLAVQAAIDMTFLCRAGQNQPGKTSGGVCTVATIVGGNVIPIPFPDYEVFVPTPNFNLGTFKIYTKSTNRFWVRRDSDQVINTLTQPNSDAARFTFRRRADGTYRIISVDTNKDLLQDENRDKLLKASGEETDPYANYHIEQLNDQGAYRIRAVGSQLYLAENATDRLISTRSQTEDDAQRFLLEPSYGLDRVLPQFAFGDGWYSALYFTNHSGTAVNFAVNFFNDNGAPLTIPALRGSSTRVNLLPNGSAVIEAPNVGALQQGYAKFSLPSGVAGYGVFRQSIAGLPDQEAVAPFVDASATSSTLTFDETNYVTAVAVANPGNESASVSLRLIDNGGGVIGNATIRLAAGSKSSFALRDVPGLRTIIGKRGTAQVTAASGNVSFLGLRFFGTAFTSIPTVLSGQRGLTCTSLWCDSTGGQRVLPQLVTGGGWYTALYFSNGTGAPVSFPVSFLANNGQPLVVAGLGASTQVAIAGGATAIVELPNSGATLQEGFARFTLPPGVLAYAVFRQTVPGRPDQEAVVPLSETNKAVATLTYDESNFTTAVAIVNPGTTNGTVTIDVFDEGGQRLGTSSLVLAPLTKRSEVLRSLSGLSAMVGKRGRAVFTSTSGAVSVLGLRFSGSAFTSIPAGQ